MALAEPTSVGILSSQMAAAGLVGPGSAQAALAYGNGLTLALRAVTVVTADVGTVGVGVGTGVPVLVPTVAVNIFLASLASSGVLGPSATQMGTALGLSLSLIMATATAFTAHPVVGTGAGVMSVIPNGSSFSIISAAVAAAGMTGVASGNMITAVSLAFETCMPLAVGPIAIVGPPSIIPGGGVGTGALL